jgi:hypothetical protein
MITSDFILGSPEVSPLSVQEFRATTAISTKRTAVLVAHGMGQQVPYETIDGVAQAAARGAEDAGAAITSSVIRSVRLGTENKNDVEPELVRAEFQITDPKDGVHEVHVYEAYWAPITEGKVSASDVVRFLLSSGWNGIRNTSARTYRRWMFGRERQFTLSTELLVLVFVSIISLLLALLFINALLVAAAASHAIAHDNPFPKGLLLVKLTWNFVTVDAAAVLVVLGILVGKMRMRLAGLVGFFLVGAGAAGFLASSVLMFAHLADWRWANAAVPGGAWAFFVQRWPLLVTILWAIEFSVAYQILSFLIEYVGDVAAYIAAHSAWKFSEIRQQIWKTAMRVASAVYRAKNRPRRSLPV